MTLTADSAGDALSILGRYGIITSETANPDKVLIDVDLAALPGLEVDGSNLLKAKVDGTTIGIDGSGQLYSVGVSLALDDLNDTNVPAPTDKQVLAYDTTSSKWTAQTLALAGSPGTASADTQVIVDSVTPTASSNAATKSHTHAAGAGQKSTCAIGAHSHYIGQFSEESGLASATHRFDAMNSVNTQTAYQTVYTSASPSSRSLAPTGHSHGIGTLAISIT